jgi:hypothetical protein
MGFVLSSGFSAAFDGGRSGVMAPFSWLRFHGSVFMASVRCAHPVLQPAVHPRVHSLVERACRRLHLCGPRRTCLRRRSRYRRKRRGATPRALAISVSSEPATSVDKPSVRLPSWHPLPELPVSRMSRLPMRTEPTRRRQRRAEKQAATADRRERCLHPPFAAPLPYLAVPPRASAGLSRGLPLAAEIAPAYVFTLPLPGCVHPCVLDGARGPLPPPHIVGPPPVKQAKQRAVLQV